VFGWFDDDTLGLNLDPSHLIWQQIDVERVVREFGPRLHHVHLKDLEVDREGLYEHGVLSAGIGWQVPRLPGLGQVDWGASSRRSTGRGTTGRWSSSTRTATSRAATSGSRPGSGWPAMRVKAWVV
jgi:sugar phosphate isomerase/epimerase